ncbi:ATP-dependent sacrificial sulfur transferase LarE [Elusimicrobiota bacterium]
MNSKLNDLKDILGDMKSVLIAFSGGVDSTFLVKVARDTLGDRAVAVTAHSESYPDRELKEARRLAADIGVRHIIIDTEELKDTKFSSNPARRCFWCKTELFKNLRTIAKEENLSFVIDGANYDDTGDFRPGIEAADKLDVRHPLIELKMTKEDIRSISRELKLETWNKPAYACLASRIPYGENITGEKLVMVEKAEEFLKSIGMEQVRVRNSSCTARIEVDQGNISKLSQKGVRDEIVKEFRKLGYKYVTLDLQGYRSGSMNEVL